MKSHLDCTRVSNQIPRQLQHPEIWDTCNLLGGRAGLLVRTAEGPDSKEACSEDGLNTTDIQKNVIKDINNTNDPDHNEDCWLYSISP